MEKLAAKSRSSNAKVIGSIISIAGAFVLTFYKGQSITNSSYTHHSSPLHQPIDFLKSVDSSWAIAGILLTIDYFLVSLWYILQVGLLLCKMIDIIILLNLKCKLRNNDTDSRHNTDTDT